MSASPHESRVAVPNEPARLPVAERSIEGVRAALAAGELVRFDARSVHPEAFRWDLADWDRKFGDHPVNTHVLKNMDRIVKAIESAPEGEPISLHETLKDVKSPGDYFDINRVSMATLIASMRKHEATPLEPRWARDIYSAEEVLRDMDKLGAYGVVNARTLPGLSFGHDVFSPWSATFSFLWFGLSPGGLHYDEIDNTLIQLHGTKKVLVYAPDLTDAIDGARYIRKFNDLAPLAPSTLASHKYLRQLPYQIVELRPGEGMTIPARAYHAPFATSYDSISLNTFLLAHYRRGPFPYVPQIRVTRRDWGRLMTGRMLYTLFRYTWLRLGPYEFV